MNLTCSYRWFSKAYVVLALALAVTAGDVHAQQPRPELRVLKDSMLVQELHLRDGTKLVGHVVSIAGDQIAFRTVGGIELDLMRRDIVRVREIGGFRHEGEYWEQDAADSRLFVFPTGRVPSHGRGYFGVYELVIPSVGFGIGDIGMLSAGMSLVPGVSLEDQVFYIAPKLQLFDVEYVQASVGAIWLQPGSADEGAGLGFGVISAGSEIASITGGVGIPLYREQGFDRSTTFILGGELRVTRNIKLMTENWILPNDVTAIALGLRILAGPVIVELAGVTATEADLVLPLVSVSFVW